VRIALALHAASKGDFQAAFAISNRRLTSASASNSVGDQLQAQIDEWKKRLS